VKKSCSTASQAAPWRQCAQLQPRVVGPHVVARGATCDRRPATSMTTGPNDETLAHPHPALIHAIISVIERLARAYLQATHVRHAMRSGGFALGGWRGGRQNEPARAAPPALRYGGRTGPRVRARRWRTPATVRELARATKALPS
jgi:hypothetical protein